MSKKYCCVVIIGPSGSGKTTLGHFLSKKWGLPLTDLDDLHWLPGWKEREREEERADVERVVEGEKWVIVGNYSRYRDLIWYKADLIVWLDVPLLTCLFRGLKRSVSHIWHRKSLCNGNYDSLSRLLSCDNRSILYWILTTHRVKQVRYQNLLEVEKDHLLPKHIHLRSSREIAEFMRSV